jgi:lipopolysaccharide export system protein LptC
VRILRVVLPTLMIAVVGALAGLVTAHALKRHAAAHREVSVPVRMSNPHFFGRDQHGRAFAIRATQAARDEQALQTVLLEKPALTLNVGSPKPSTLTADTGVYHEDTNLLLLRGHVRADNAQTSTFATDVAEVNTKTGAVSGPKTLSSQSAAGDIQSDSFDIYDKGARVILRGDVHGRLNAR